MTDDRSTRAWCCVFLVVVAVYVLLVWPALYGPFVFDDFPNLAALAKVGDVDSWRALGIYLSEARGFPGRPLSMLTFLAQSGDWPGNPLPFKAVNLSLHVLNAALVAALCRRLLSGVRTSSGVVAWLPFAVAAAWLIHPMQLSGVFLVVQRMTLLSSFFVLAGLLAYLHGIASHTLTPVRRGMWMTCGIGLGLALSILSKENGILLVVYAWIADSTLLRMDRERLPPSLARLRWLLLFPAILALGGFLANEMRHPFETLATRGFSIYERLLTEPRVLLDYLSQLALPRYATYGVYHDDYLVSRGLLTPWTTLPSLAIVIAAVALGLLSIRRRPMLAFGILWFIGGHALESGPVSLELYFEHRNYLPFVGPLLALLHSLSQLPARSLARKAAMGLFAAWAALALLNSLLYARIWSDPADLAYFWAQAHPDSPRAQGDFADLLFKHGNIGEARRILSGLASRRPDDVGNELQVLYLDCVVGHAVTVDEQALRQRLRTAVWSRLAYQSLGSLRPLASQGKCGPSIDASRWRDLTQALLDNPAFQADGIAMGYLHYQRHELALEQRDLNTTLSELDETARYEKDPEIVRLKAKYLLQAGLPDDAIEVLRTYDPSQRPLLRRLLVDDVAINREGIAAIRALGREPTPANAQ